MATNRIEGGEAGADKGDAKAAAAAGGKKAGGGSALMAWLPLVAAVVLMPVIAWAVTTFVLLPKLQKGLGITPPAAAAAAEESHGGEGAAAEKSEGEGGGHGGGGHGEKKEGEGAAKGREQVPLTKLMVNVAGTSASRILMASIIMTSATPDFKSIVKSHEAQLRDTACGVLSTKTITDLVDKPGARNIVRSELITAFNGVLGGSTVQEIYFTDFAIQ